MIHSRYVKEEVREKKDGKVKKKKNRIVALWVARTGGDAGDDPLMVLLLESPTDLV